MFRASRKGESVFGDAYENWAMHPKIEKTCLGCMFYKCDASRIGKSVFWDASSADKNGYLTEIRAKNVNLCIPNWEKHFSGCMAKK
ncbi:hypothetical protein SAMN02910350_00493 [Pseudobutyrivibrio xylanivorans]|uniref:Uncharacterized protein n=2 Tax=Pseudobutyrivibrio xylanivorans TaxID=185007 RepID=A0A1G5RRZ2_PSEXY|nr:hypothetical protein SAMN02910350_00493 [Pseudobutyrivibrio xylanivorans]